MNYYIQGSAARAEGIRAAFEKLAYDTSRHFFNAESVLYFTFNDEIRATTDKLFKAFIKSRPDYQELELPVKPKFKVGDKVIYCGKERTITFMDDKFYDFDGGCAGCRIEKQDVLLSPAPKPHYDIANLKPFDKVLLRFGNNDTWRADFFSHIKEDRGRYFVCIGYANKQCVPFEGNEHLLGTTDMPSEEYINW